MEDSSPDRQPPLEELMEQVRELQQRVRSLEQRVESQAADSNPEGGSAEAVFAGGPSLAVTAAETAGAAPVLGKALLAIAGAYLLRAVTESGALPQTAGAVLGIAYAMLWLFLAARASGQRRLVIAVHGLTAVMVLAPLLWEMTVRFHVLSTWATASVLIAFSVFGLAVSWRGNLDIVAWITTVAGLFTATALLLATRDVVPFALALLAIATAVEFSACRDHWLGERWIVAGVVDLSVLLMTSLVTREAGVPEQYAPIPIAAALAIQIALLVIYLGSTVVRTLVRDLGFTFFETAQTVVAFLIGMGGALATAHGNPAATWSAGLFAVFAGATCYVVSFAFLERSHGRDRNFYTYATFAFMLVVAGTRILLGELGLALAWSALALASLWMAGRAERNTLRLHGALYLILAALFSGLWAGAAARLLGAGGASQPWTAASLVAAAAAISGYVILAASTQPKEFRWTVRLSSAIAAANLVWAIAGLLAGGLVVMFHSFAGIIPAATVRTAVLTVMAAVLAWAGTRWSRVELVWLVYALMAVAAYKLLTQDLRQEATVMLFVSLLFYGGTLILLPRLLQKTRGSSSP